MKTTTPQIAKGMLITSMFLMCAGCALQQTILTAPMVSMSDLNEPAPSTLKAGAPVEASYCTGDEPQVAKDKLDIGMMDEVIFRAQQQSGAKFIQNATFIQQGTCLKLEGIAMK